MYNCIFLSVIWDIGQLYSRIVKLILPSHTIDNILYLIEITNAVIILYFYCRLWSYACIYYFYNPSVLFKMMLFSSRIDYNQIIISCFIFILTLYSVSASAHINIFIGYIVIIKEYCTSVTAHILIVLKLSGIIDWLYRLSIIGFKTKSECRITSVIKVVYHRYIYRHYFSVITDIFSWQYKISREVIYFRFPRSAYIYCFIFSPLCCWNHIIFYC